MGSFTPFTIQVTFEACLGCGLWVQIGGPVLVCSVAWVVGRRWKGLERLILSGALWRIVDGWTVSLLCNGLNKSYNCSNASELFYILHKNLQLYIRFELEICAKGWLYSKMYLFALWWNTGSRRHGSLRFCKHLRISRVMGKNFEWWAAVSFQRFTKDIFTASFEGLDFRRPRLF